MDDTMLDISQIATLLQCSDSTIRRLIDRGKLLGERLSPTSPRRVRRSNLEQYIHNQNITVDWSLLETAG